MKAKASRVQLPLPALVSSLDLARGSSIKTDIWIAASGFGLAVAISLLLDGSNVVRVEWNEESSAEVMKGLEGFTNHQADVSDYPELAIAFARTWKQYGRLYFGDLRIPYAPSG